MDGFCSVCGVWGGFLGVKGADRIDPGRWFSPCWLIMSLSDVHVNTKTSCTIRKTLFH